MSLADDTIGELFIAAWTGKFPKLNGVIGDQNVYLSPFRRRDGEIGYRVYDVTCLYSDDPIYTLGDQDDNDE